MLWERSIRGVWILLPRHLWSPLETLQNLWSILDGLKEALEMCSSGVWKPSQYTSECSLTLTSSFRLLLALYVFSTHSPSRYHHVNLLNFYLTRNTSVSQSRASNGIHVDVMKRMCWSSKHLYWDESDFEGEKDIRHGYRWDGMLVFVWIVSHGLCCSSTHSVSLKKTTAWQSHTMFQPTF